MRPPAPASPLSPRSPFPFNRATFSCRAVSPPAPGGRRLLRTLPGRPDGLAQAARVIALAVHAGAGGRPSYFRRGWGSVMAAAVAAAAIAPRGAGPQEPRCSRALSQGCCALSAAQPRGSGRSLARSLFLRAWRDKAPPPPPVSQALLVRWGVVAPEWFFFKSPVSRNCDSGSAMWGEEKKKKRPKPLSFFNGFLCLPLCTVHVCASSLQLQECLFI